jgi:hypothetical protein
MTMYRLRNNTEPTELDKEFFDELGRIAQMWISEHSLKEYLCRFLFDEPNAKDNNMFSVPIYNPPAPIVLCETCGAPTENMINQDDFICTRVCTNGHKHKGRYSR